MDILFPSPSETKGTIDREMRTTEARVIVETTDPGIEGTTKPTEGTETEEGEGTTTVEETRESSSHSIRDARSSREHTCRPLDLMYAAPPPDTETTALLDEMSATLLLTSDQNVALPRPTNPMLVRTTTEVPHLLETMAVEVVTVEETEEGMAEDKVEETEVASEVVREEAREALEVREVDSRVASGAGEEEVGVLSDLPCLRRESYVRFWCWRNGLDEVSSS